MAPSFSSNSLIFLSNTGPKRWALYVCMKEEYMKYLGFGELSTTICLERACDSESKRVLGYLEKLRDASLGDSLDVILGIG